MEVIHLILHYLSSYYWIPLLLIYLGVILTVLIENRNPTKTIAWILVIVFLPFLGLFLYYLFGQKFTTEKRLEKINEHQLLRIQQEWGRLEPIMEEKLQEINERIGNLSRVYTFLKNERLSFPSLHNQVELLINGEQKFQRLKVDLLAASHSIHMEYYIFEIDTIGKEILNILEKKAEEGVRVRIIIDSFGSPNLHKYLKRKKKNIHFSWTGFLPVTFTSLANSNYRNHRKIAVIDGKIGYTGGINIADRYINLKENKGVYWRDTAVRVVGDSVAMLQLNFWNSWMQASSEPFHLDKSYILGVEVAGSGGNAAVSYVSSNPGSKGPYNMEALLISIGEANKKIQLVTPYYIPSEELETALMIAAASGVEVEIILPKSSDSFFVQHASFSFLKPLLKRGVKVYLYDKGFIHAKTVNVDDKVSFIGTVNLDTRSFYINYEIAAVVADPKLCQDMNQQFQIDKGHSKQLTLEGWLARSKWKRGIDSLCRLLAPLL